MWTENVESLCCGFRRDTNCEKASACSFQMAPHSIWGGVVADSNLLSGCDDSIMSTCVSR